MLTGAFILLDVILAFIFSDVNYIHLFDSIAVNIIFTLLILFGLLFYITYVIERIYGEITYKKNVEKKKEEVKREVNN